MCVTRRTAPACPPPPPPRDTRVLVTHLRACQGAPWWLHICIHSLVALYNIYY
jgi:hypothetical protein